MWIWFGLAALALIGEVMSGTFYLLLVALGLAGGGLATLTGFALHWQIVICGVLILIGVLVLRLTGVLKKREIDASRNANVNLDIGQRVQVQTWSEQRTARVHYRGAQWQAVLAPGLDPVPGWYEIVEINGAQLMLAASRSPQ